MLRAHALEQEAWWLWVSCFLCVPQSSVKWGHRGSQEHLGRNCWGRAAGAVGSHTAITPSMASPVCDFTPWACHHLTWQRQQEQGGGAKAQELGFQAVSPFRHFPSHV